MAIFNSYVQLLEGTKRIHVLEHLEILKYQKGMDTKKILNVY